MTSSPGQTPDPISPLVMLKARDLGDPASGRLLGATDPVKQVIRQLIAEIERLSALSDVPEPCVMTHTPPLDFAQCETHDETFPLGAACKFHGRDSIASVYADEADAQRARAVLAELELERSSR